MLYLWARQWWSKGWKPVILTLSHAKAHPSHWRLSRLIDGWPTVNPRRYERACFLRWLAYAKQKEGLFVDYDISAVTPAELKWEGNLTTWKGFDPMMVGANQTGLKRVIDAMLNYQSTGKEEYQGKPHLSDMYLLRTVHLQNGLFENRLVPPSGIKHFSNNAHSSAMADCPTVLGRTEWMRQSLREDWKSKHAVKAVGLELRELTDSFDTRCLDVPKQKEKQPFIIDFTGASGNFSGSYNLMRTSLNVLEYRLGFNLEITKQHGDLAMRPFTKVEESLMEEYAEFGDIEMMIERYHLIKT